MSSFDRQDFENAYLKLLTELRALSGVSAADKRAFVDTHHNAFERYRDIGDPEIISLIEADPAPWLTPGYKSWATSLLQGAIDKNPVIEGT